MSKQSQPNIVFIMADQLAAQALSFYGNGVCKTPNLERLAEQGTVFKKAYSNNPLCVPSRASLLSGRLSPTIGVHDNANELASATPTMAHYLRKAGYYTELCGKMHFIGPDQLHGFNTRSVTDVYPENFQWIADWKAGPALFFAHGRHRHRVTKDHLRDTRQAYYGMISYIDDKVGRILDTLEKTGLRDNTVVVFTSDHGEMLGERGMWFNQCFWEWFAHVPLVMKNGLYVRMVWTQQRAGCDYRECLKRRRIGQSWIWRLLRG